jgi:hypothetical protein
VKTSILAAIAAVGFLIGSSADAGQFVYPGKGQDKAKQASDETECSAWARQQTGFDPAKAPATSSPLNALTGSSSSSALSASTAAAAVSAVQGGGGGLGSAAGVLGAVQGGGGPAGMLGAAAGQTGGAASQAAGLVTQAISKQQPQASSRQADYDKARAACLIGRGYSVQ